MIAIGFGINQLREFESTPGMAGISPPEWPANSTIRPHAGQSMLVMMVHPQCSCTRASLSELDTIMRKVGGRVSGFVLFVKPPGMERGWERTSTWSLAQHIPGVTILVDPDGAEAARFGALTSGHAVLYDPEGHLLFSGGITSARGHAGDNMGREAVLMSLRGKSTQHQTHAVFGCPLTDVPTGIALP